MIHYPQYFPGNGPNSFLNAPPVLNDMNNMNDMDNGMPNLTMNNFAVSPNNSVDNTNMNYMDAMNSGLTMNTSVNHTAYAQPPHYVSGQSQHNLTHLHLNGAVANANGTYAMPCAYFSTTATSSSSTVTDTASDLDSPHKK
jgi:hypothetical protein